ncbi:MAG: hypothetical protein RJB61_2466 [Actinomycetota bacterium]
MHVDRPGWYPDPTGRYEYRWHNGTSWTGDVAVDGRHFVDVDGLRGIDAPRRGRRLAVAALVVALCSLAVAWLPVLFAVSVVGGLSSAGMGIAAARRARDDSSTSGLAKGALAVAAAALCLSVLGGFLTVQLGSELAEIVDEEPGPYEIAIDECTSDGSLLIARGTIQNRDDSERHYDVTIAISDLAGVEIARGSTTVLDVAPSGSAEFTLSETADHDGGISCEVVDVRGRALFFDM